MTENSSLLTQFPGFVLRRAAQAMMAELAGNLAELDLRISDVTLLILIDGREDMTASHIGRVLEIKRANIVPILARLEESGLVSRTPLDGKSQAVVLTDEGKRTAAKAFTLVQEFEQSLLNRIPPEHREHLLPALSALLA